MSSVRVGTLPAGTLLESVRAAGAYTDCYVTDVPGAIAHSTYVEAFYTTSLFKIERQLLAWFAQRPASDADAKALAHGRVTSFSAWRVEARSESELLLADMSGRTKSWLMTQAAGHADGTPGTRLHFGSAVLPVRRHADDTSGNMGVAFQALLGFHKLYSRLLLGSARARALALTPAGHTQK